MLSATDWILDELSRHGIKGTFFVVGQIARHSPGLVRAIHEAGHEAPAIAGTTGASSA